MPLRERNALLLAAGYAPAYRETRETDLGSPELGTVGAALQAILRQQVRGWALSAQQHQGAER